MKVELLAPGGSYESVIAAYNAGADAVYTGGMMFGARAGADNLTTEQLIDAINYSHIHGKKLYLTVNTLLKDKEIEGQLYDFIEPLYKNGLDAVIVQDIGVISFISKYFPGLHVHASTQMTIFGKETVKELEKFGVTRIVTPREMSLKEIKDIRDNSDIEIESFVHGALCYCYSGQCFMSSYIGGRSGNRGRCAQPCRMEYDVIKNGELINPGDNKYVLSPKDICTLNILPKIIDSGVCSLKIEGRMKKLEYIAGVVSIYRKYIDLYEKNPSSYRVEQTDIDKLSDLFNRNGFNESYYEQHNGRNMISLKRPQFRKENREFVTYLKDTYSGKKLKRKLNVNVKCVAGHPIEISTVINGNVVLFEGNKPMDALNKPIDSAVIEKQIRKTGNTDFVIDSINIVLGENLFVPVGVLNELRRGFIQKVYDAVVEAHIRKNTVSKNNSKCQSAELTMVSQKINVCISSVEQLESVLKFDYVNGIYLECSEFNIIQLNEIFKMVRSSKKNIYLAMPYVFRMEDKKYFDDNYRNLVKEVDGILIRNLEQYYYLKNIGVENNYIFDYNVYTINRMAKEFYRKKGITKMTAPLELNNKELMSRGCEGDEIILYGYMPAMISAGCSLKTCNMCHKDNQSYELKDQKNNVFKTKCVCSYCYNIIYNCKPLSLFKYMDDIVKLNAESIRLSFTFENKKETIAVLEKAKKALIDGIVVEEDEKSTRGHFKRGVL